MWLSKASGSCRSRLLTQGWTEDQIVRVAACTKLITEIESEAVKNANE